MDFNSNDEYLKAFPLNFGPNIQFLNKERLCDLKDHGLPPKDPQENAETIPVEVPEPVCFDEELECVEVQEPIQVDREKADYYGDGLLEKQEEILTLCDDLAPEIDEPMPQMADMALLRDEEMVIDDGDGGALETMLSLGAIEESLLDGEPLGEIEVKGLHSEVESIEAKAEVTEAIRYVGTKAHDTSAKDFATDYSGAEISVIVEGITEEAALEDEIFEEKNLREFIKSTRVFAALERPVTDVDRIVDSIMNDIGGIEAGVEDEAEDAGLEASIESNTKHQKVIPTYEKPVGIECEDLTCHDHVRPSEGHV